METNQFPDITQGKRVNSCEFHNKSSHEKNVDEVPSALVSMKTVEKN